jgi:acetyltransferase-like isoleucine patch superfamily enzyme
MDAEDTSPHGYRYHVRLGQGILQAAEEVMGFADFVGEFVEQGITLLPDSTLGIELRRKYWRWRFVEGSDPRRIGKFSLFKRPDKIFMGHSIINNFVMIDATFGYGIHIGDGVFVGPYSAMFSYDHEFSYPERPIRDQGYREGHVVIEDDVWIGSHVVITKDVVIGKGSVIGAGSVVTKSIPPMSIAYGSPAVVMGKRN